MLRNQSLAIFSIGSMILNWLCCGPGTKARIGPKIVLNRFSIKMGLNSDMFTPKIHKIVFDKICQHKIVGDFFFWSMILNWLCFGLTDHLTPRIDPE